MRKGNYKMQEVNFGSVHEFLEYLPVEELRSVELLRKVIFDCLPDTIEKLCYNVPYYKRHKNFLFIWPASILWGKKKSYEGVRLGFTLGYLMNDEIGWLDKGNRKQVYFKDFESVKQIDIEILRSYIFEAAFVDEQFKKRNRL